jgi:hypothetical protein
VKPHDCEGLNDMECWHADLFAQQLELWQGRNLGAPSCFKLARLDAQKRFPLEGDEVARVDEYLATRFGYPGPAPQPEREPLPAPRVP